MYHYYFFQEPDYWIYEFISESELTREEAYDLFFKPIANKDYETQSTENYISAISYAYILLLGSNESLEFKYTRLKQLEQLYIEESINEKNISEHISLFHMSCILINEQDIDILNLIESKTPSKNENISDN